MANPAHDLGTLLLNTPIAWEPGLYGSKTLGTGMSIGGMNLNYTGFRDSFASCEYPGEDMLINYTAPYEGNLLYHLVFLAEWGSGNLSFVIQTDFSPPFLNITAPEHAVAEEETSLIILASDNITSLERLNATYTLDKGFTWHSAQVTHNASHRYIATIPAQERGVTVHYHVEAEDILGNVAIERGNYTCTLPSQLSLIISDPVGGNATRDVRGLIIPTLPDTNISLQYRDPNEHWINTTLITDTQGEFRDLFTPNISGLWTVSATWPGNFEYDEAHNITQIHVREITHTVTISPILKVIGLGEPVSVNGTIQPLGIINPIMVIIFTDPHGNTSTIQTPVASQGTYEYLLTPSIEGIWTATAMWLGTGLHVSTTSTILSFEVSGGILSWILGYWYFIAPIGAVPPILMIVLRRRNEE
jgi:hypothetical protein